MNSVYFQSSSPEHQRREKTKGRELRQSQWWRQQLGKGICYHCGGKFLPTELTMDHLIPVARGGKSNKKNCVPCCKECNTKKGHKLNVELTMEQMSAELQRLKAEGES